MESFKYETNTVVLVSDNRVPMKITLETDNEILGVRLKRVLNNDIIMKMLDNVKDIYLANKKG